MNPSQLNIHRYSQNNPDGFYRATADFAGAQWEFEVGYRIVSAGTQSREVMTPDGLERDEGEAPTVRLCTLELIGKSDSVLIGLWALSPRQRLQLESEISDHLVGMWA